MDQINQPSFTLAEARSILQKYYGIDGTCKSLVGYAEHNYLVETSFGDKYLLKIPFEEIDLKEYEFHHQLYEHLHDKGILGPRLISTTQGDFYATWDDHSERKYARLLTWVEGGILDVMDRRPPSICQSLGQITAENTKALLDFNHSYSDREFRWNSDFGTWTKDFIHLFSGEQKNLILEFITLFEVGLNTINDLPKSIIHNDINECNVILGKNGYEPIVVGLIDFGDACYTAKINNLAIALSYVFQYEEDILKALQHGVSGYQSVLKITREECRCLYALIGIRLVISLTSGAIAALEKPDSLYHQRSVFGSWKALHRLKGVGPVLFEEACLSFSGLSSKRYDRFEKWAINNRVNLSDIFRDSSKSKTCKLDLGLESSLIPHDDHPYFEEEFAILINRFIRKHSEEFIVGGYGEVRSFYITDAFRCSSLLKDVYRTKHIGIDIIEPAGTAIYTPFQGEVELIHQTDATKDYGVLMVLKHVIDGVLFYTLYGHLSSASFGWWKVGDEVKKGEKIAELGSFEENGNWIPHLHFQVILDMLGKSENFDGVARPDYWSFMSRICPDPLLLLELDDLQKGSLSTEEIYLERKKNVGFGLSLSYDIPLHIVRGKGVYLIDSDGQKYLDTVNNVAHVGHENYNIVASAQKQMATLNTNTRYLSAHVVAYAKKLLCYFSRELSVVHFTNSGSEANELALRMARAHTGRKDILAIEVGYHGNTQGTIDISSYKFDAQGGGGKPSTTHLLDLPDSLRGKHRGALQETASFYIQDALDKIDEISNNGTKLTAFIHESILSCGGQIVLPPGYLKAIYKKIHELGGVVIADEVQVGFGRVGAAFWGFELQDVTPDIVVLGKPMGNGHPMGAVVCTKAIAESFDNGMEYFNTFGGNPVSAVTGLAVLEEIEDRDLQNNAWLVGNYIMANLRNLQLQFPVIADVRGHGLFIGMEFLDVLGNPAADYARYFVNAMKERMVLMSSDGPDHNVIKIKPPITFTMKDTDFLIGKMKEVLL